MSKTNNNEPASAAEKPDLSFVHCNKCKIARYEDKERQFAISSCGHIVCCRCITDPVRKTNVGHETVCPKCRHQCKVSPFAASMPPNAAKFLSSPLQLAASDADRVLEQYINDATDRAKLLHSQMMDAHKNAQNVYNFQQDQMESMLRSRNRESAEFRRELDEIAKQKQELAERKAARERTLAHIRESKTEANGQIAAYEKEINELSRTTNKSATKPSSSRQLLMPPPPPRPQSRQQPMAVQHSMFGGNGHSANASRSTVERPNSRHHGIMQPDVLPSSNHRRQLPTTISHLTNNQAVIAGRQLPPSRPKSRNSRASMSSGSTLGVLF